MESELRSKVEMLRAQSQLLLDASEGEVLDADALPHAVTTLCQVSANMSIVLAEVIEKVDELIQRR